MMSDADAIRDMLTRAGLPFSERPSQEIDEQRNPQPGYSTDHESLPPGAFAIDVPHYDKAKPEKPAYLWGGYSFDHEFLFDADGNLLALWGWE